MYILTNSRIGSNDTSGLFWQRNTYAGLYASLTSYIPWMLDTIFKTTNGGHDNFYSLFITIIPLLACIAFVSRKENNCELLLLIIFVIMASIKPLSSLMHGFSEPSLRWLFLPQLYILLLASLGLESINTKNQR